MNADQCGKTATERMLEVVESHMGKNGGVLPLADESVTFSVSSPKETLRRFTDVPDDTSFLYGRMLHPTVALLGEMVAALEGSESGYAVASGLSAIHIVVTALTKPGDHVVVAGTLYGGSMGFFRALETSRRVKVTKVDITDHDRVEKALAKKHTKLLFVESVSNPLMVVADIPRLAAITHEAGAQLVVDNTFAPFVIEPIKHGADIVVHSLTKYASGYSDITAGGIACRRTFWESMLHATTGTHTLHGAVLDPSVAHKLIVRMQDMYLRFCEASRYAAMMAHLCEEANINVLYPGLRAHPQHKLMNRLALSSSAFIHAYGYGGVLALDLGSYEKALQLHAALIAHNVAINAVSLGSAHTYAICFGGAYPTLPLLKHDFVPYPQGLLRIAAGRTPEFVIVERRLRAALLSCSRG